MPSALANCSQQTWSRNGRGVGLRPGSLLAGCDIVSSWDDRADAETRLFVSASSARINTISHRPRTGPKKLLPASKDPVHRAFVGFVGRLRLSRRPFALRNPSDGLVGSGAF